MVSNDLGNPWLKSVSTRYVIGPELDIGLPFGFAIEVDALYRRQGYQVIFNNGYGEQYATSWEFPFLLKKSFPFPAVKPFAEGGVGAARAARDQLYQFDHESGICGGRWSAVRNRASAPGAGDPLYALEQ